MTSPFAAKLMLLPLGVTLLTAGCSTNRAPVAVPVAAMTPSLACPWLDGEHDRVPVKLSDTSGTAPFAPARFVAGCAIIRFRVAADGSVSSASLRAANPLNDGPTALIALRNMRFQPARSLDTRFVIRLDMRQDRIDHLTVTTETRPRVALFGNFS